MKQGRQPGRRMQMIGYGLIGGIGVSGLSGCGLFRRTSEKQTTSLSLRNDSIRVDETNRLENHTWKTTDRLGRLSWQETVFSPPDSTGRQSIRRVRTATLDTSHKTVSRDTATLRSSRQTTEIRHTRREAAQAESREPGNGGFRGGFATGLFFVLLVGCLFCYLKGRKRR